MVRFDPENVAHYRYKKQADSVRETLSITKSKKRQLESVEKLLDDFDAIKKRPGKSDEHMIDDNHKPEYKLNSKFAERLKLSLQDHSVQAESKFSLLETLGYTLNVAEDNRSKSRPCLQVRYSFIISI